MGQTEEDLPPALITAVRSGFDAFIQLQRIRFSKCLDTLSPDAYAGNANHPYHPHVAPPHSPDSPLSTAFFPTTLCEWSDLLLSRLKAVGVSTLVDPTAEVVWELVSVVLAILEGGGDDCVNASVPYLEWYRGRFVHPSSIGAVRDSLVALDPRVPLSPAQEADIVDGLVGPYMASIQRAFLAGLFPLAAELVASLVDYLRSRHADPFDAAEESSLAHVVRLLAEPPDGDAAHRQWAATANALVVECKRTLEPRSVAGAFAQTAQQLKSLCLDLLLMMSGDAMLLRQVCDLLQLDVMDYAAAVCAVCEPSLTLRELHSVYADAMEDWTGARGPWYVGVVERLLGSRVVLDIVGAMELVGDAVRRGTCGPGGREGTASTTSMRVDDGNIVSSPSHTIQSPNESDTEDGFVELEKEPIVHTKDDDDDDDDEEEEDSEDRLDGPMLMRQFALLFTAAHIADLCAPPFGAPVEQLHITFARNDLVTDYVALFQHHPLLWRTAAMYVVYSPLTNPAVLHRVVTACADSAARDRYTFLSLHTFVHTAWDEGCAFQTSLVRLLRGRYPMSATLTRWVAAAAHFRRLAMTALHERLVAARLASGATAQAVWLAVECQQATALQIRLERALRSSSALERAEVRRVGDAVGGAFIPIDSSANMRMLRALRLCAALAEFRAAAEGDGETERLLRAAERALRCAVPFRAHPAAVLAVVEAAADAAGRWPQQRRPPELLPLLSDAMEVALVGGGESAAKYAARAEGIREKMMRLL